MRRVQRCGTCHTCSAVDRGDKGSRSITRMSVAAFRARTVARPCVGLEQIGCAPGGGAQTIPPFWVVLKLLTYLFWTGRAARLLQHLPRPGIMWEALRQVSKTGSFRARGVHGCVQCMQEPRMREREAHRLKGRASAREG